MAPGNNGNGDFRIAIAHDFAETFGGAERVTAEIAQAFPSATVYALLGRRSVVRRMGVDGRFVSLLPSRARLLDHYRYLAPLLPLLSDRLRLPPADLVISSSYGFAHRLRPRNEAKRVCFIHSPLRFAWSMTDEYCERLTDGPLGSFAFRKFAAAMRASDRASSRSVDRYLTQSDYVAAQVREYYGQPAEVIGAPLDCDAFRPSGRRAEDYFLFCGRLIEPYKNVHALITAFNQLRGPRLVIAGDGPDRARLESIAGPQVEFVGALGDEDLIPLMQACRALLHPSRDDFGLVPLEAMACGRPVLAYGGGGALWTVKPGVTGELFEAQTAEAIADAVSQFDAAQYDPERIREHALGWDRHIFHARLRKAVLESVGLEAPIGDEVVEGEQLGNGAVNGKPVVGPLAPASTHRAP